MVSNVFTRSKVALPDAGTPRSVIGNDKNWIAFSRQRRGSWARSKSAISSLVSSETMTSTPAKRHSRASSSSQSPPRGRGKIASLPCQGASIHGSSALIAPPKKAPPSVLLLGKRIDLKSSVPKNPDAVVAVDDGPIWSDLERPGSSWLERICEFNVRHLGELSKFRRAQRVFVAQRLQRGSIHGLPVSADTMISSTGPARSAPGRSFPECGRTGSACRREKYRIPGGRSLRGGR